MTRGSGGVAALNPRLIDATPPGSTLKTRPGNKTHALQVLRPFVPVRFPATTIASRERRAVWISAWM